MPNASGYQNIIVGDPARFVRQITLDRPKQLNALSGDLLGELAEALAESERDDDVRAIVLTGGATVFAAGADLKRMVERSFVDAILDQRVGWTAVADCPKPVIAAVNGFALGGGCEIAMQADMIVAGDTARFGQPEINLGIIPGAGGTQRLVRAVGKSLAIKMILAGDTIDAATAMSAGLVAEVVIPERTVDRAIDLAAQVAAKGPLAARLAKQAVNAAFEMPLSAGLDFERRLINLLFATEDMREGVGAFVEKRKPTFSGK
jgi:enoyl-CoA hydratase